MFTIIYWFIALILAALYSYFFYLYIKNWKSLPFFSISDNFVPKTHISVLIPARNEEDNIIACLSSIVRGTYPTALFEVIVIDDHSDDATPQYVQDFGHSNVHLLELKDYVKLGENQPYKKRAIEIAIKQAAGDLIVTTDADCIALPNWLMLMAQFYETQGKRFIAAPVNFYDEKSLFERFQSLDYIGMMGITGAGVQGHFMHMCNGANLAYDKTLFADVGGFKDIDHVASGDDMLLMQKIAKIFPKSLGFLKNPQATVLTKAKPNLKEFFSQRLRWASKSSSYTEGFTVFQLIIVYLFFSNIFFNLILSVTFDSTYFYLFLIQIAIKISFDYYFLKIMTRFFSRQDLMPSFFLSQCIHFFYILTVGALSNVKKKYIWKGRIVK